MAQRTDERYLHKASEREKRRAKRRQERQCRDIRRRIGGCVFALGVPLIVTGGIILIVSNVNRDSNALPAVFEILGPLLTSLSVLFFIVGALLTEYISMKPLINCVVPNNPQTCPLLFKVFRTNDQTYIDQQVALKSLQTAPPKSAMRKPPNPDIINIEAPPQKRRGVTFSGSDTTLLDSPATSTENLDPDQYNAKNSSQSSLVSLRHCKVFPQDDESDNLDSPVYTVSQSYFDMASSKKGDDDVFYRCEDVV